MSAAAEQTIAAITATGQRIWPDEPELVGASDASVKPRKERVPESLLQNHAAASELDPDPAREARALKCAQRYRAQPMNCTRPYETDTGPSFGPINSKESCFRRI